MNFIASKIEILFLQCKAGYLGALEGILFLRDFSTNFLDSILCKISPVICKIIIIGPMRFVFNVWRS